MKKEIDIAFITGNHPSMFTLQTRLQKTLKILYCYSRREPHSLQPGDFYNGNLLSKDEKDYGNFTLMAEKKPKKNGLETH